jgi:hypothetical protein
VARVCLSQASVSLDGEQALSQSLDPGLNILHFESEQASSLIAQTLLVDVYATLQSDSGALRLSKESFAYLAGVELELKQSPAEKTSRGVRECEAERDRLVADEMKLAARFESAATLRKQLDQIQVRDDVDSAIDGLEGDVLECLKRPEQNQDRFDNRQTEIHAVRMREPAVLPPSETLIHTRNFQIGVVGMIMSFALSYALDVPWLTLANLFFAAMLAQVFFRRIDDLEKHTRAQARRRAVDEADARNERERSKDGLAMRAAANEMGIELSELRDRVRAQESRLKSEHSMRAALKGICGDDDFDALEIKLLAAQAEIARLHEEMLDLATQEDKRPSSNDGDGNASAMAWDRAFFHCLKTNFGEIFSAKLVEPSALDYLQRLSEGRFDGLTVADDGALTVVGPDEIFPVSYPKLDPKDRRLIELALRFGVVSYLLEKQVPLVFLMVDVLTRASNGRRLRFKDALEVISQKAQVIVLSSAKDWG